ncbi:MAG: ComF family protein [Pseudomonadota bacterium]
MQKLKFSRALYVGKVMGTLLSNHISSMSRPMPEVLIPIPLHYWRLFRRGFNQAAEIAEVISQRLEIPVDTDCYVRTKNTLAQTGLSKTHRVRNLTDAFTRRRQKRYRHVALVDDVLTTGSTANALSKALRADGVKLIEVWCFARAEVAPQQ